jgi:hypothetical protein
MVERFSLTFYFVTKCGVFAHASHNVTLLWHVAEWLLYLSTVLLGVALAHLLARKSTVYRDALKQSLDRIDAFRIGASIYLATFMIGSNWDYRLVFLLFSIPQLLSWAKSKKAFTPVALAALVAIGMTTWLSSRSARISYADEVLNWLLFIFFTLSLFLTVPEGLRIYIVKSGLERKSLLGSLHLVTRTLVQALEVSLISAPEVAELKRQSIEGRNRDGVVPGCLGE